MATIYFEVDSDTFGSAQLKVIRAAAGEAVGSWVSDTARYVVANIPVGAALASIFTAMKAAGRELGPSGAQSTPAVRNALQALTGAPDLVVESEAVIVLPPMKTAVDAIVQGAPEGQELAQGIRADPDATEEWAATAGAMQAAVTGAARPAVAAMAILRTYRLYGDRGITADELTDLLGFVYEAEAEAPVDRTIPKLPYKDFAVGHKTDCLVQGLADKYVGLSADKRIARGAIQKWFAEENGGPTLFRLKEFADRYAIPLRVYDVLGAEILAMRHENVGSKPGRRPGLALVAFGGHAYISSKTLQSAPDFTPHPDTDLEGFQDTRRMLKLGDKELSEVEDAVLQEALSVGKPSFNYEAEHDVVVKSLMWSATGVHVCAAKGEKNLCGCGRVGWDMNKAYHTSAMATKKTVPDLEQYLSYKIPMFSAMDDYRVAGSEPPPSRGKWGATYFFLKGAALERLRGQRGHTAGRVTNVLTGMEYAYLLDTRRITEDDVEGWKTASYAVEEEKLRKWLHSLDETDWGVEGVTRSMFALINGLLGRVWTRQHRVSFVVPAEERNAQDIDLLRVSHPNLVEEALDDGRTNVSVTIGARAFRRLNTRNFYHHVIGRTNLIMMKLMDDIARTNPDAAPQKIAVDAVVYGEEVTLPAWAAPIFKRENPRVLGWAFTAQVLDPAVVQQRVAAEIDAVTARCIVYTGAPGTGKTTKVHTEHQYDVALAFSNVCARNLDKGPLRGQTLHAGLGLYAPDLMDKALASLKGKMLWVDEFSTVQSWVWSVLFDMMQRGVKVLILTGDPNQTPPVLEKFRRESHLMAALLKVGTKLSEDHRNDGWIVKIRNMVADTLEVDKDRIVNFIAALLKRVPAMDADKMAPQDLAAVDVHITHSNRLRLALNQFIIETRGLVYGKAQDTPDARDTAARHRIGMVWMASKGLRLRARVTRGARGIYKGAIYELLTTVGKTTANFSVRRIYLDMEKEPDAQVVLPISEFGAFEPGYALTAHSAIGQTVRGQRMVIHQVRQMVHFDKSILYVALTRACKKEELLFCTEVPGVVAADIERLAAAAEHEKPRPPPDDERDVFDADSADFVL